MEVVDSPAEIPEVQRAVQEAVDEAAGRPLQMGSLERHTFYEAAARSYAVVATGELRFYGNFVFKKGVVASPSAGPDG